MARYTLKGYEIICGVYAIHNTITNKYYIGKSDNIYMRWNEHKKELNNNMHYNKHLQRSWNKYGEECFKFSILEKCECNEKAYEQEQYWVSYYDSYKKGYNQNEGGTGGQGYLHSEENKQKMSQIKMEQYKNNEYREKLSLAQQSIPIVQINIFTNEITHWDSYNKAAKQLNINFAGIHNCLKKR